MNKTVDEVIVNLFLLATQPLYWPLSASLVLFCGEEFLMASFFVTSMLFLFFMRMLVYLHVCAHVCGGRRSASDSISQDAVHLLFGFEIKFLTGTWELLIQPSRQAVKAPEISLSQPPRNYMPHHAPWAIAPAPAFAFQKHVSKLPYFKSRIWVFNSA